MRTRILPLAEIIIIAALASVPLFVSFPYRVNIFLSWEGAYRMSEGQAPFRDFGLPMGYGFWIIPAAFFKIFGPQLITLVKAQVFINIISGLAFRSILKSLDVQPAIRFVSVLLFCLSYSFFNFWPWYNHTVIVYGFVALAFLMKFLTGEGKWKWLWLVLSAFFTFISFFTKQDGGAMTFLICCALLLYYSIAEKKWQGLLFYIFTFALTAFIFIYPLLKYDFRYWFNLGQPPHTARISLMDIAEDFFGSSQWIKFYLFVILLLLLPQLKSWKGYRKNKKEMLFILLTLGILAEAAIFQVTSYTPPDNNIFFHAFAFVFIINGLSKFLPLQWGTWKNLAVLTAGVLLWWSGIYWKYIQRVTERMVPAKELASTSAENVVNRKTYLINKDTTEIPVSKWVFSDLKSFQKIYMPEPTAMGIKRILSLDVVKQKKDIKVLNMTELTPLAAEIPYEPEKGAQYPLWYHLGVGMFNREADMFCKRIEEKYYDLVLFEDLPTLNNFYPFRVRDSLLVHYRKTDSFYAPRQSAAFGGTIEVYIKPQAPE
jgi:hypothetical protein